MIKVIIIEAGRMFYDEFQWHLKHVGDAGYSQHLFCDHNKVS